MERNEGSMLSVSAACESVLSKYSLRNAVIEVSTYQDCISIKGLHGVIFRLAKNPSGSYHYTNSMTVLGATDLLIRDYKNDVEGNRPVTMTRGVQCDSVVELMQACAFITLVGAEMQGVVFSDYPSDVVSERCGMLLKCLSNGLLPAHKTAYQAYEEVRSKYDLDALGLDIEVINNHITIVHRDSFAAVKARPREEHQDAYLLRVDGTSVSEAIDQVYSSYCIRCATVCLCESMVILPPTTVVTTDILPALAIVILIFAEMCDLPIYGNGMQITDTSGTVLIYARDTLDEKQGIINWALGALPPSMRSKYAKNDELAALQYMQEIIRNTGR